MDSISTIRISYIHLQIQIDLMQSTSKHFYVNLNRSTGWDLKYYLVIAAHFSVINENQQIGSRLTSQSHDAFYTTYYLYLYQHTDTLKSKTIYRYDT